VTPDAGLFAAAYAVATATITTLWVMSSATDPASRSQALLHPYRGLQRIVSDAQHSDGTRGLLQTLAQQKHTLFTAQQERDRARATLQSLNEAVVTTDTHGRIDYLNPAAEVLTGWSAGMAMGQEAVKVIAMVSGGKQGDTVSPIEQSLLTERTVIGEHDTTLIRRDGSHCEIDYTCAPVRDAGGRFSGLVLSMRDVSETRDMQARLSWAATHDGLTGLINRREFEARLSKLHTAAVADGTSHALCFIDLDHFKTLNDTCGHLAGDDFLKGLAETLRGRIRGADTLARLGGDEFAVLLYSCPLDVAARIAENLRRAVADYCAGWKDHTPLLGASIGVVTITDACKNLNDILATADLACYAAKSEGRNRVNVFRGNAEMLERWQGEVRWLQIIQTALEENRFVLHWQPIRTLADGTQDKMCELFVHLRDADSTLHAPADFLPTAQRYHLMPAIDFWVVSVVANALRTWHAVLSPMDFIGINLSTQSVTDERFEVELMDVLSDSAIPAYKLCFQISEAAFMSHPARIRHLTARLKARGCRLAVDECGVGVGSFNHLRSQEVDYLKIHDEFTRELAVSAVDREVVLALHRIVHCMGGRTIAERVADEAVLKQLAELGIDYAQGFAVARPEALEIGATPAVGATQVA
jgi:diguanylate cyclase (GGDEF)-like protein/PAS domain S-box-containing protein